MTNVCLSENNANGSLVAQIPCTGTDFYEDSVLGDFVPRAVLNHPVDSTFL